MAFQVVVIAERCAAVCFYLDFCLSGRYVAHVGLYFGRNDRIGRTLKVFGFGKLVFAATEVLLIMLYRIRNIGTYFPLSINRSIGIRHKFGEGIRRGEACIAVPACKGVSELFGVGRLYNLFLKVLNNHRNIRAAARIRHDHIPVTQVIPIERDGACDCLGAKGHRLLSPSNNHFTREFYIVLVGMHGDGVGLRIVGELIVCNGNLIVFAVTEVCFSFGVVPIVINGLFCFA